MAKQLFLENVASDLFIKFGVGKRDLIFEIIDPKYGDHKHIKGKTKVVLDGTISQLRYAPAFDTPFVKEQKFDTTQGGKIEVKGITFNHLRVYAPKSNPCLQKFMLINPLCIQMGGKLFDVQDEDAKRTKRLEATRLRRKAAVLLEDNYDVQKLASVAIVLQPANPSIINMQIGQLEELISNYIDKTPQVVIDAFNNDEADLIYSFNKAISIGLITIDVTNSKVVWTETGGKIFDVPQGVAAHRRWITFVNSQEGQIVYDVIKERFGDDK